MYTYILVVFLIFFLTSCIISENELLKSLFYAACFIITLWINIPCFVNVSELQDVSNNLIMLPFRLYIELGIFYIIFANAILGVVLYMQAYFSNNLIYTYKEVKRKYDSFGDDAIELYVMGRDLDFLDKKEFKKQKERMIHLRDRCKLLCESTKDEKLLDLYKNVCQQGVEIRFYTKSDNITNLKGQIKLDHNGNRKAIFMSKSNKKSFLLNKKYVLFNIDNQFLVTSILERFNEIYQSSSTEL